MKTAGRAGLARLGGTFLLLTSDFKEAAAMPSVPCYCAVTYRVLNQTLRPRNVTGVAAGLVVCTAGLQDSDSACLPRSLPAEMWCPLSIV
jgi:hypothetical protein